MSVVVLGETRPVARKTHICETCWGVIGGDDRYFRQRNVGEDGAYTFKSHSLCRALSLHIAREAGMWTDEGEWPEPHEVRAAIVAWFAALGAAASGSVR